MPALKLARLPDRTAVKLSITVNPRLARQKYASPMTTTPIMSATAKIQFMILS